MNAQDLRKRLCVTLTAALTNTEWVVSLATKPVNASTYLVQIGHATLIAPDAYAPGAVAATFTITLWVNEGNDAEAADALYAQLARADGSITYLLQTTKGVEVQTVGNVGLREDGPTGFLAGDIELVMHGRP